jgi:hypothetical protein
VLSTCLKTEQIKKCQNSSSSEEYYMLTTEKTTSINVILHCAKFFCSEQIKKHARRGKLHAKNVKPQNILQFLAKT